MSLEAVIEAFGLFTLLYFAALNGLYLVLTGIAWRQLGRDRRRRAFDASEDAFASPMTPGVSLLLPAYNEEAGIVASVRSLLRLRYPELEIVVIDDGSQDATFARLQEAFDLVRVRRVVRDTVPSAPIVACFASRRNPEVVVVRKENGGSKADATNAGLRVARHPLVACLDADGVLDQDALLRMAAPFIDDPDRMVAVGGTVRIVNGCRVEDGVVVEATLPRNRLATLQVLEYLRAFLVGRVGWSALNALMIVSGAFGLFRRDALEAAGGWDAGTLGEDAELVVRLHRRLRERGEPYRIAYLADPVCWTEAPEDLKMLGNQRRRWQRGLAETLWRHRRCIGRPRYGPLGVLALPYFLVFELLGPVVELASLVLLPLAWALGLLNVAFLLAFLVMALLLGVLLSIAALALEELSYRRHARMRDVLRLLAYAVVDNVGYRQLNDVWRVLAFGDLLRGRGVWTSQTRRGIGQPSS